MPQEKSSRNASHATSESLTVASLALEIHHFLRLGELTHGVCKHFAGVMQDGQDAGSPGRDVDLLMRRIEAVWPDAVRVLRGAE
jgi:hypothetical protein